jgi:alkylated DNA repair protein alkB family protein 6
VQASDSRKTDFKQRYKFSLLLEPRSLLVLQDECYTTLLHGIEETTTDVINESVLNLEQVSCGSVGDVLERGTRVSLTIRFVPKTTKPLIKLGRK